jgi:AraC-like DNA-binding protein
MAEPALPDAAAEPEAAIACYEQWSGLAVAVHDVGGVLGSHLRRGRHWHETPLCQLMKDSAHGARCLRWDIDRLRPTLAERPGGVMRVCHAGMLELVVPVLRGGGLELVLFAGQRTAGADLTVERDDLVTAWPARTRLPPAMDAASARQALEGLRQLGARLRLWLDEHAHARASAALPRGQAIRRFIAAHHREEIGLADLARHLGLSLHRAAHVVRESCGRTFVELVTDARVASACALLRHSDRPVAELAGACGFGDPDHFHRVFRRRMGITPHRYRLMGSGP